MTRLSNRVPRALAISFERLGEIAKANPGVAIEGQHPQPGLLAMQLTRMSFYKSGARDEAAGANPNVFAYEI
jgi:hypothetical protein